jgi:hypothetical protein
VPFAAASGECGGASRGEGDNCSRGTHPGDVIGDAAAVGDEGLERLCFCTLGEVLGDEVGVTEGEECAEEEEEDLGEQEGESTSNEEERASSAGGEEECGWGIVMEGGREEDGDVGVERRGESLEGGGERGEKGDTSGEISLGEKRLSM